MLVFEAVRLVALKTDFPQASGSLISSVPFLDLKKGMTLQLYASLLFQPGSEMEVFTAIQMRGSRDGEKKDTGFIKWL